MASEKCHYQDKQQYQYKSDSQRRKKQLPYQILIRNQETKQQPKDHKADIRGELKELWQRWDYRNMMLKHWKKQKKYWENNIRDQEDSLRYQEKSKIKLQQELTENKISLIEIREELKQFESMNAKNQSEAEILQLRIKNAQYRLKYEVSKQEKILKKIKEREQRIQQSQNDIQEAQEQIKEAQRSLKKYKRTILKIQEQIKDAQWILENLEQQHDRLRNQQKIEYRILRPL